MKIWTLRHSTLLLAFFVLALAVWWVLFFILSKPTYANYEKNLRNARTAVKNVDLMSLKNLDAWREKENDDKVYNKIPPCKLDRPYHGYGHNNLFSFHARVFA